VQQAGEGKKAGCPLTREIPNPRVQIPSKLLRANNQTTKLALSLLIIGILSFTWDLGFGIWDFRLS
jgi:hypothetical protein